MTLTNLPHEASGPQPQNDSATEVAWVERRIWPTIVRRLATVRRAEAAHHKRIASVAAAALRVARRFDAVECAKAKTAEAGERLHAEIRLARGPYDGHTRIVSTKLYALILIAVAALAYNIDRGALLVLLLPLDLTRSVALGAVILQLIGAHYGGHLLRRRHDAIHPVIRGRVEWVLTLLCLLGTYGVSVILALIRAVGTGWLAGALFLALGVLDMTAAVVASYLYTHDGLSALERAQRHERLLRWRHARSVQRLRRRVSDALRTYDRLREAALRTVLEYRQGIDAAANLWQRNNPGIPFPRRPEPELIARLDDLTADPVGGEQQVNAVLAQAGVTLQELTR